MCTPKPMTHPRINLLHLTISAIWPGQELKCHYVKGQIKVTSHCTATPPNQCAHQISIFYTLRFLRFSPVKIFKFEVIMAESNQGHTMTLNTYIHRTNVPTINILHLMVSEIQPGQAFSHHPTAHQLIQMPWVKTIPAQPLVAVW